MKTILHCDIYITDEFGGHRTIATVTSDLDPKQSTASAVRFAMARAVEQIPGDTAPVEKPFRHH